jgi:hypothetical protein
MKKPRVGTYITATIMATSAALGLEVPTDWDHHADFR